MALIREVAVPIEDLNHLAVECVACHTVMILDLRGSGQITVTFCPTCRHDFEPAIKDRVRALVSLLEALASSKECRFAFRIPSPEKRAKTEE